MTSEAATKPGRGLHITMWVIALLASRLTDEYIGHWWAVAVFVSIMLIYATIWAGSQELKKN